MPTDTQIAHALTAYSRHVRMCVLQLRAIPLQKHVFIHLHNTHPKEWMRTRTERHVEGSDLVQLDINLATGETYLAFGADIQGLRSS